MLNQINDANTADALAAYALLRTHNTVVALRSGILYWTGVLRAGWAVGSGATGSGNEIESHLG
ncbi:hypothetical protein OG689_44615 [Kitasatospora sp. NBC_00240]|uniref:hypothetical protein n=1 Tax=Kitasatospora sp. NBC_00240 TaxID=2903567 RepID=UPI0022586698|nr:hypothetical protein [Kitasatospora sp. NBC_00240]MCX5216223.1 hypothetical protein [Kitasatospora sp. NBC_00240]